MNWGQVTIAAGAGAAALVVLVGGGYAAFSLFATQFGIGFFSSPPSPTLTPWLALPGILICLTLMAFGAALPARALGAGWGRSLLAVGLALALLIVLYVMALSFLSDRPRLYLSLLYLSLMAVPTMVCAVAVARQGVPAWPTVAAVCIGAVLLWLAASLTPPDSLDPLAASTAGLVLVAASWPVLPAVAALARPG